jgi:hypothetical protein
MRGRRKVISDTAGGAACRISRKLHLCDFDTLIGAYLDAAHAADAFPSLIRVGLAVGTHLVYTNRADVYTLTAAGAAVKIYIDQIHSLPPFVEIYIFPAISPPDLYVLS